MDSQTQTVELLKLLGIDAAEAVLDRIHPDQAKLLRGQLQLSKDTDLRRERGMELLDQFERFMEFAGRSGLVSSVDSGGESDSLNGESEGVAMRLTGDPLQDLMSLSIYQIAGALETEQARTVAILINEFNHELAADVLSLLMPDHRAPVVKEMVKENNAPRVLIERIARATLQRALTLPSDPPDRRDRLDRLSDVLRSVPRKLRKDMMASIIEDNEETSQALMKKLYRFDDLISLDGRKIQQVLGEIDGTTLTTAMFQAGQEIMDAILGNLSRRARQSIEEELAFQSRVPDSRVEAAREAVAEVIARLDQEDE